MKHALMLMLDISTWLTACLASEGGDAYYYFGAGRVGRQLYFERDVDGFCISAFQKCRISFFLYRISLSARHYFGFCHAQACC